MDTHPPVANKRRLATAPHVLIILAVVAGFVALQWVTTLPERMDDQQTVVVGQTRFAPDSDGSVRVVVQDFGAGQPIAGAHVKVSLKPDNGRAILLFEGQTDETGSLPVRFHVPADAPAEAQLVVETRSAAGRDRVEQPVTIQREYRLLLTSDKSLYQPAQTIHMRALALSTFDLTPARGAAVDFLVEDPKGNKVFRQSVTASDFGVAAADFTLADLVNQGDYKLSVSIGDTRSEKTVEVRPYVLPKFGVNVSTDRSFYLPGQCVEGVVQADYFFGKPVAQGQVRLVGSVWDVERTVVVDISGQTGENGTYEFGFDLPEYFAGSGLELGQAQFVLEVTVVDQTDHAEQTSQVLPIAAQPLVIEAVAESGVLKPGVENIVYVLTSYPDGRPAPAWLQIRVDGGEAVELTSGEFGLTEFTFTPQPGTHHILDIFAQDETGLTAGRQVDFETEYGSDSVLLRADRAAYVVGETMNLVAFTPVASGDVYLDIVKSGQTLSTRSARVTNGKAEFAVDVSPDLYGTLELHAYKVLLEGTIVRDTRLVVVDAPNDLAITVTADRDTYLPGEMATISFQTSGAGEQGSGGAEVGVQSALGVAIVDESVFALQRQDPGFAKLYFLLEQELLEPFYQIKGFELPASISPDQEQIRLAQDEAAKATWAGAPVLAASHPINSRQEKMSAVLVAQEKGFERIGQASVVGLILIPLLLWVVVVVALRQTGIAKRSLKRLAVASGILLLTGGCMAGWFTTGAPYFDPEEVLIPLADVFGLGVLIFVGYAWAKRDPAAKFITLLTLAWGTLLFLLIRVADRGGEPAEGLIIAGLIAYLLIPGAYLLFGQARWVQERRFAGALVTGLGALSALPAMVILPAALIFTLGRVGMPMGAMAPQALRGNEVIVEEAMFAGLPAPTGVLPMEKAAEDTAWYAENKEAAGAAAPRLRQYFPETLYWAPEIVTDENGFVSLEIPMADSITTWRLTALASSQDGRLGFTTRGIRVFQDFFVDVDLPVALTQGDEISIPVGVFNYLPEAQEVRLVVEQEDWFELLESPPRSRGAGGGGEQRLAIASNDVEVVYFPIRVLKFGRQGFQVTAWGEKMSDAIRREVNVVPDGKEVRLTESDWLRESKEVVITIPPEAVPETPYVEVKVYPGVMAQAVEGLEKILRLPHGCFEQTTSATYPNVLILDYMQSTDYDNPEAQMQAEKYVGTGYQRLLTFEVQGGGFSLFGDAPANPFLTAYGLMEFNDMAKVYPVDEALIERTAQWLLAQQGADGTWTDQGYSEHWHIDSKVPTTAYIAWALIEADYEDTPQVAQAIAYIREFALSPSPPSQGGAGGGSDAYSLALVANALSAYDPDDSMTRAVLDRLYDKRVEEGDAVYWQVGAASFMGATGESGSLETTALAAIAFIRANTHADAVSGALAYLIQGKDSWGTWFSTQATILSLKALLLSTEQAGQVEGPARLRVSLNREQTQEITIDESNADVVHLITFDRGFSPSGSNRVQIELEGGGPSASSGHGNMMYQVATRYYLPWDQVPMVEMMDKLITIDVGYDRTALAVNDEVTVDVDVRLNREGVVRTALIDLGVPPGFTVLTEDLSRLVEQGVIARYELTGRQIIVYLEDFSSESPLRFSYRLRARFPMRAQTPPSSAYDYYNPADLTVQAPLEVTVSE